MGFLLSEAGRGSLGCSIKDSGSAGRITSQDLRAQAALGFGKRKFRVAIPKP